MVTGFLQRIDVHFYEQLGVVMWGYFFLKYVYLQIADKKT